MRVDPVVALAVASHEAGRLEKRVEVLGSDAAPALLQPSQLGPELHEGPWYYIRYHAFGVGQAVRPPDERSPDSAFDGNRRWTDMSRTERQGTAVHEFEYEGGLQ